MATQIGTASSIQDLFSQLNTFAAAQGWTVDHSATDRSFYTKTISGVVCSVAFRWSTTSPTGAGVYQHTAFINSSTDPGNHTNDSGQGAISGTDATIMAGRSVPLTNGAMDYWFIAGTNSLYVFATTAPSRFVCFGFGTLLKRGTWTGGAFSFGYRHAASGTNDLAINASSTYLLDGRLGATVPTTDRVFAATVHTESLPGQAVGGRWSLAWGGTSANTGNDRGGTGRGSLQGGYRAGPIAEPFARFGGAPGSGLVPAYPVGVWYDHPSAAQWYPLGYLPDIRGFNIDNFAGGEEIVIGSDTWIAFPARYRTEIATGGSRRLGVLVKKIP